MRVNIKSNFHNTKTFVIVKNNAISKRSFNAMIKRLCPHSKKSCGCSWIVEDKFKDYDFMEDVDTVHFFNPF